MKNSFLSLLISLFALNLSAQIALESKEKTYPSKKNKKIIVKDSSSIVSFRNKKVWYSDLGFNNAPFSIRFKNDAGKMENLFYRNNMRAVLGLGFSYKWFSLRFGLNLPGNVKPVSKFGTTRYIDLGFDFSTKKRHFDFDFDYHEYQGYAQKNAYKWNASLNQNLNPHLIFPKLKAQSFSINVWRFFNKKIQLSALRGKTAMYIKEEKSFYIKTTFNTHGIMNDTSLIPTEKTYDLNSKTKSEYVYATDFGLIPGYVYVNRFKNWQFSGMFGFGPVIQAKNYGSSEIGRRTFLGLAPRMDIRLNLGYNIDKHFFNLVTEFDNKSIRFNDLAYRQTFYMIKLVAGIRL